MHKDTKNKIQKRIHYLMDNNQFPLLMALYDRDELLKFCFNYNRYYNHESFIAGIMRKCKRELRVHWSRCPWDIETKEHLLSQIEHLAGEVASI